MLVVAMMPGTRSIDSPSRPMITPNTIAGTVASTSPHAIATSASRRPVVMDCIQACQRFATSVRKYASTATSVPRCMARSKPSP